MSGTGYYISSGLDLTDIFYRYPQEPQLTMILDFLLWSIRLPQIFDTFLQVFQAALH